MSVEGNILRVASVPGEANILTVGPSLTEASMIVTDSGAPLIPGPGCPVRADSSASCSAPVGSAVAAIEVDGGDLDDSVTVAASVPPPGAVAFRWSVRRTVNENCISPE